MDFIPRRLAGRHRQDRSDEGDPVCLHGRRHSGNWHLPCQTRNIINRMSCGTQEPRDPASVMKKFARLTPSDCTHQLTCTGSRTDCGARALLVRSRFVKDEARRFQDAALPVPGLSEQAAGHPAFSLAVPEWCGRLHNLARDPEKDS